MLRSMAWHMLILMSGVVKGPKALTEVHSAGDPNPGEEDMILPITFIFKDGSLYECNMNTKDFEYFDGCRVAGKGKPQSAGTEYTEEPTTIQLYMINDDKMFWEQETSDGLSDIDHVGMCRYRELEKGEPQSTSTGTKYTKEPITIHLDIINDDKMFLQLKMFWEQETSDGLFDIDVDKFFSFLKAADSLGIRGDAYKRFIMNMVRKGLFGTHSQGILGHIIDEYEYLRGHNMSWYLFLGFAAELGCEVRVSGKVMTLCPTGSVEYGKPPETKPSLDELRIAPDAFSRNKNVGTHIAHHLFWLLWYLDLHELDLSSCKMDENDVDALSKAGDVGLQAMNVSLCRVPGSLAIILPHLKDLTKLDAHDNSLNEANRDALAVSTLLIELNIERCFWGWGSPGSILPHLKNFIKLDTSQNSLNEASRDALAASTLLTELDIGYCFPMDTWL
jgi:hypothetical protein